MLHIFVFFFFSFLKKKKMKEKNIFYIVRFASPREQPINFHKSRFPNHIKKLIIFFLPTQSGCFLFGSRRLEGMSGPISTTMLLAPFPVPTQIPTKPIPPYHPVDINKENATPSHSLSMLHFFLMCFRGT